VTKQRALAAAMSAQQYAEFQIGERLRASARYLPPRNIAQWHAGLFAARGSRATLPQLCRVALALWVSPIRVLPAIRSTVYTNTISATGTRDTATQAASYVQAPVFNIIDLGPNKGTPAGEVYQVDAWDSAARPYGCGRRKHLRDWFQCSK